MEWFRTSKYFRDNFLLINGEEFQADLKADIEDLRNKRPPWTDKKQYYFDHVSGYIGSYLLNGLYSTYIERCESILRAIKLADETYFKDMHKGSPYYFCGVAAFMGKDFEKAVYYFDAAFAEDFKHNTASAMSLPAALFMALNDENPEQYARDLTRQAKGTIETALSAYCAGSGDTLSLQDIQDCFLKPYLKKEGNRSAVTALISYVLERDVRKSELSIASEHGGTMEPFFLHLFKGCVLFESLLAMKYKADGKTGGKTLWPYLDAYQIELGISSSQVKGNVSFEDAVAKNREMHKNATPRFNERVVKTAYMIRNTTGHNISWNHRLSPEDYERLADDILFAILLVISKLLKP